jgi:protein-tyrosine-phosphatase
MAAALANDHATAAGIELRAKSAGVATVAGYAAAELAHEALAEIGLSLEDHRSQPVTKELLENAALVVAVTDNHREMLRRLARDHAAKIVSLRDITGHPDLADPIGGKLQDFRKTRDVLRAHMPRIIAAVNRYAGART